MSLPMTFVFAYISSVFFYAFYDFKSSRVTVQEYHDAYLASLPNVVLTTIILAIAEQQFELFQHQDNLSLFALTQVFLFLMLYETTFYTIHRVMHHPRVYWWHAQHHQYKQRLFSATTFNASMLEHVVLNMFPFAIAAWVAGFGSLLMPTVIVYAVWNTVHAHSGYGDDYHLIHHTHPLLNFGLKSGFMDYLFGTRSTEPTESL
ncbi:sterol desaturase family protein [bacterium]|nr:sterol desaturase family protein [bacterium]